MREKAVDSLEALSNAMGREQHLLEMFPLVIDRLAKGDLYSMRMSGCGLLASVYLKVNALDQIKIRQSHSELCHDDTPMVRRSAAIHMSKIV